MSNLNDSSIHESTNYEPLHICKNENKKRKFRPLQGLRRIFSRQKSKEQISADDQVVVVKKRMKKNNSEMHSVVLSVSHESIFRNDSNCLPTSNSDLIQTQTTISTSTDSVHKIITGDEYKETENKFDFQQKFHSSCSESSITSRASSTLDLDLKESSKLSLDEKTYDDEVTNTTVALNHNAAKHKIAIKPKKTYALPRRFKKVQNDDTTSNQITLETTVPPEETKDQSEENNMGKILEDVETSNDEITTDMINVNCSESQQKIKIKSSSLPPKIQFTVENLNTKKLTRSLSNSMSPVINRNSFNEFSTSSPQTIRTLSFNDRFALNRLDNHNCNLTPKIHLSEMKNQSSPIVSSVISKSTDHKFKEPIPEFLKVQLKKVNDLKKESLTTLQKSTNNILDNKINIVEKKHKSLIKDDEPELLKVFARRSLLLKDIDSDNDDLKGSNSDKENENDNQNATVSKITESFMKIPQFKNIQQRKEEWEKRFQQSTNVTYKQ